MTDPFRHFYEHASLDLSSITDLPHRHFRILLPRGMFLKIASRIRSGDALQKWLIRYRPSDVYYSTSCWLAPEKLGRRERTPLSENIFLSADIVFDIDRTPFSLHNLELARRDTLRLLAFCDDNRIPVKYIAFSGSKGFHVVCADTRRYPDPSPLVREDMAKAVRREILARVLGEGINVDTRITADTRRILRVPGTINGKSGYICTVLSRGQIAEPAAAILKYIPRVNVGTPQIPPRGDDSPLRGARIIPWLCHRFGVRSKPPARFSFATYLVSTVPHTPLHVPLFHYPPGSSIRRVEQDLVRVQQQYGLSDIYLYQSETGTAALCLRTFPLRRLEKIIRASGSTNYGTLVKYRQIFFRVGEVRAGDQTLIAGPPAFIKTLSAAEADNTRTVSGPHYRFLQDFVPALRSYPRMHGDGPVVLTHTVNEE